MYIKTGSGVISYQWDKTSGNYVKLEYGTETELMTFKIPMIKVIDKLPEGEYESKQTFGVSGVLQLNWQHPEDKYRNQSFYLPVTFDDIKTDVIIKVDTDDDTTIPPPPPPGRYHLWIAGNCPWASKVSTMISMLGLGHVIEVEEASRLALFFLPFPNLRAKQRFVLRLVRAPPLSVGKKSTNLIGQS